MQAAHKGAALPSLEKFKPPVIKFYTGLTNPSLKAGVSNESHKKWALAHYPLSYRIIQDK